MRQLSHHMPWSVKPKQRVKEIEKEWMENIKLMSLCAKELDRELLSL